MLACPLLLTTAIENMVKLLILHLCYTTRESWERGCVEGRFFSAYFVILSGLVPIMVSFGDVDSSRKDDKSGVLPDE